MPRSRRELAQRNKGYWSKKLALMTEKRNRRIRDYINKIARKRSASLTTKERSLCEDSHLRLGDEQGIRPVRHVRECVRRLLYRQWHWNGSYGVESRY